MAIKTYFKVNPETGKQGMKLGVEMNNNSGHSAVSFMYELANNNKKMYYATYYSGSTLLASMIGSFLSMTPDMAILSSTLVANSQMVMLINNNLSVTEFPDAEGYMDAMEHFIVNTSQGGYFEFVEIKAGVNK